MTNENAIARAKQAEQIVNDPLVIEILDALERKWLDAIVSSPVDDTEGREGAYRMLKSMQQFRGAFVSIMDDGKIAAAELERK